MHAVVESNHPDFSRLWTRLVENDPLQNPLYTPGRPQASEGVGDYSDRSFMVLGDEEPVFGCSLTLHTDEQGRRCLGYFGIEASTLVNRQSMHAGSNSFSPDAGRLLQTHFCQLIESLRPDALDYLDPVACGLMSPLTQVLLERGGRPTVCESRLINLALSKRALLRLVSAPYRRLIDWGRNNLELDVLSGSQAAVSQTRFEDLFLAGETPTELSTLAHWQTCHELMLKGQGYLVRARQRGFAPATAAFVHNSKTAYYVMDDTLLDDGHRPLLQSMVWQAIEHARDIGCSQFDMGCIRKDNRRAAAAEQDEVDSLTPRRIVLDPDSFGGTPQTRLKVSLSQ